MESPAVFVLIQILLTFTTDVLGQTIYASPNPATVDSNVTLFSDTPISLGTWTFERTTIVIVFQGLVQINNDWSDRTEYNGNTSALKLNSVQLADSGEYQLEQFNSFAAQLQLSVQVPISNPTLVANERDLVEHNDTAVLVCSVSNGTSLTYQWLNDDSVVAAGGRVQISGEGSTLTIGNVTRDDEGPFRCNVSNGVSQDISPPVQLNISYGPSNTSMSITPEEHTYRTGSNITLACSADSSPAATVEWMVDERNLNNSDAELQLLDVKEENSGNYKCVFFNRVTCRFSSASAMVRIMEPISAVMVNDSGDMAIHGESFSLTCEADGSVDQVDWWRDGSLVSADNTTSFGMSNKTLTLNPVQLSDGGQYQCRASNAVSKMSSDPYRLVVNYGPMTPVIVGPTSALAGATVTLNCSSDSHPPSQHSWYFNSSLVASSSVYHVGPLTSNASGEYTCVASNNITGKNSSAATTLMVLDPVTMASVKVVGSEPVVNQTFTLTCDTRGSVHSITWMYHGMQLNAGGSKNLSLDNATLTFDPVMRSDDGNYSCEAANPHSSYTGDNFTLTVSYGPEMTTIMGPSVGKAGENITLTCEASSNPPSQYKWFYNNSLVANTSEHVIPGLTTNVSGIYTCVAENHVTGLSSSAYKMLSVYDPITAVAVEPPTCPAVEGDACELRCVATGFVEQVTWVKNGEPLLSNNRTVINPWNSTVTFDPLHRNDSGHYRCVAANPYENRTSEAQELVVNYGPETPEIDGPSYAETGQSAVFSCSALSVPASEFSWWFKGLKIASSAQLTTGGLSLNMSGEYTCMASNNVTGKNSTSTKTLTVIETIQSVLVKHNVIPINGKNFSLSCEVVGPYDAIHWMKDNMSLAMNDSNLQVSNDTVNSTIHFRPLTRRHEGGYQCVAANSVRRHESPSYELLVNYGPLNMSITGPDSAKEGTTVSLTCSAESQPKSDFTWFLQEPSTSLENKPTITFTAMKSTEGSYICQARNPVTNTTMMQSKTFTLSGASHFSSQNFVMLAGLVFAYLSSMLP